MNKNYNYNLQFVIIIFGIIILPIANISLADMVDQSFTSGDTLGTLGQPDNAQTFTVGLDGILSKIYVEVERNSSGHDLVMDVRNTIGGVPIEDDLAYLAQTTISYEDIPYERTWIEWDLESSGISVNVGDVLAIVLRVPTSTDSASYFWLLGPDLYTGGQRWGRSSVGIWNTNLGNGWNGTYSGFDLTDMNFKTCVVPLPGAVLLGILGMGVAGVKLRKHV